MRDAAFKKMALEDFRSQSTFGWEDVDRFAMRWAKSQSDLPFIDFAVDKLCEENAERYSKKYDSIKWAENHMPRNMLKAWCDEHAYDFITLCRIIDDEKMWR